MACGRDGHLNPPASEEGVAADEKPVGPLARKSCEGSIDLPARAGIEDVNLHSEGLRSFAPDKMVARRGSRGAA